MNIIEITIEGKVRLAWDELDHPSESQFYLSKTIVSTQACYYPWLLNYLLKM